MALGIIVMFPDEETVAEVRTVVRTERHVHDTEDGPVVEERTITTTYEDDVAVNEHIVDRTVPLTDEERKKYVLRAPKKSGSIDFWLMFISSFQMGRVESLGRSQRLHTRRGAVTGRNGTRSRHGEIHRTRWYGGHDDDDHQSLRFA